MCGGEGVISKNCVCSLEAPTCYNWVNMSKWSMWRALGAGENCCFCTDRAWMNPVCSGNKHSAFALLKPQHNRIAIQPSPIADVSLRIVLNLWLVGKLGIIGFVFTSDANLSGDNEQKRRWWYTLLRYSQWTLKRPSLIYFEISKKQMSICLMFLKLVCCFGDILTFVYCPIFVV